MGNILDDPHILKAVMHEFESRKLPHILHLKSQVDNGGLLDETEMGFMKDIHQEILQYESFVETHPEFTSLYIKFVNLYCHILDTALNNEKSGSSRIK